MSITVWRVEKARIQYSSQELRVYHSSEDCQYPPAISKENLEEDTVQVFGEPLMVRNDNRRAYLLCPCRQCFRNWNDDTFKSLIRHINAPWQRRRE